jgi:predicted anti-sigma-YlaC factor YlaD
MLAAPERVWCDKSLIFDLEGQLQMTSDRLKCNETVELVTEYLEKALLPEMEAMFNRHLDSCPDCTIYVDQMRRTLHILRRLTDETTSGEEKVALLQIFQGWRKDQVGSEAVQLR